MFLKQTSIASVHVQFQINIKISSFHEAGLQLTFLEWVYAVICVEFVISLLFLYRFAQNSILVDVIHFSCAFRCHS